jgi:threonine/homoserine/homoserine lactone efflux protein
MSWELYLSFVVATVLIILLPGPVVSLLVANSLRHGAAYGLRSMVGTQTGNALQLVAVGLGLTALIAFMAHWFDWVRLLGAGYLVWLGIKRWREVLDLSGAEAGRMKPFRKLFAEGFVISLTNPKSLAFLAVFLPQFIDPAAPIGPQLLLLCVSYWIIALLGDGAYVFTAGSVRRWLVRPERLRWINRFSGGVLIAGGAWLALQRP